MATEKTIMTANRLDGKPLLMMLKAAAATLKYPSIRVKLPNNTAVKFYINGGMSSNNGGIAIVDNNQYPENAFYGKITPNGVVQLYHKAAADQRVMDVIYDMIADPLATAKINGQAYGYCCFCCKELTNSASLDVGYGPICAEKFGLPWGSDDYEGTNTTVLPATLPEI